MIYVKLRQAIEAHLQRTGVRLTYEAIADKTGISVATLQSLAARPGYNTRLSTIGKLCDFLGCSPGDLLEMLPSEGRSSQSAPFRQWEE